ncbi:MAG: O-sialoglycoprotein endopeptidase [Anaerofustis stercorihominis]|nr:O-sialoglycoprotein endopeptidase [Anaerofustis stercorihominis]
MILGLDTSNYTTSVSVIDDNGTIVFDGRKLLPVKKGARGLRQSEAVFEHIRNLPLITAEIGIYKIDAVCVSVTPRRVDGSYMPCFLVGKNFGKSFADIAGIRYFETTHQEGHIAAALHNSDMPEDTDEFIFVHISGGTTEILLCKKDNSGFISDIIGGTADISAGQFIDRIGVSLGLGFPCGAEMDRLYNAHNRLLTLPTSVKGTSISFSGVETKISSIIDEKNTDAETIISAVFRCVGRSIGRAIKNASEIYGIKHVLIGGGVASSNNIRSLICAENKRSAQLHFAENGLSSDNAVGVAIIGKMMYEEM